MLTVWAQVLRVIADFYRQRARTRAVWAKLQALGIGHGRVADTQHEALELYAGMKACMEPADFDLAVRAPRLAAEGASLAIERGRRSEEALKAEQDALALFSALMATCSREDFQRYRENPGLLARDVLEGRTLRRERKDPAFKTANDEFRHSGKEETEGLLFSPPRTLQRLKVTVSEDRQSLTISPEYGFAPAHERGADPAVGLRDLKVWPRPFLDNTKHRATENTEGESSDG